MRFEATFTNLPNYSNFAPPPVNVSAPDSFGHITTVQTAYNAGNRTGNLALRLLLFIVFMPSLAVVAWNI